MQAAVYSMKDVAPTAAAVLGLPAPAASAGAPIAPIVADLAGSRRLAILAPDALGILPWRLWKDRMPYLSSLHARRSILLEAILPSSTPMNFACMLTGAELAEHGMETRTLEFRCETLFDVVRRAGGRSAGAGQRGYSGELLLGRCADLAWVAERGAAATVGDRIIERFERDAPMFLIAQFGNVDSVFHKLGPSNPDVAPMLEELDRALARLVPHLAAAGAGVVLLADHGQHDVPDAAPGANRGTHGTACPEDRLVPCTWRAAGP